MSSITHATFVLCECKLHGRIFFPNETQSGEIASKRQGLDYTTTLHRKGFLSDRELHEVTQAIFATPLVSDRDSEDDALVRSWNRERELIVAKDNVHATLLAMHAHALVMSIACKLTHRREARLCHALVAYTLLRYAAREARK